MPSPNYDKITTTLTQFIRDKVHEAKADGVIFGLSGGIDSAVVASLCKKAIGNNCLALMMPNQSFTPDSETDDGVLVATKLHLKYEVIPIDSISNMYTDGDNTNDAFPTEQVMKMTIGNLNARLRAIRLYYEGQKRNYLVVGTDDKSEYMIGYFTKYGDGASDLLPIADLYKTQVKELAHYLGVPKHIIAKPSSPHLWKDHQATNELGMGYDQIDIILQAMESSSDVAEISKKLAIPSASIKRIMTLNKLSEHKRHTPPIAKVF